MKIRLEINDDVINHLKDELGVKSGADVVSDALTILNWVVSEVKENRLVLSSDKDGENVKTLTMPDLVNITKNSEDTVEVNKVKTENHIQITTNLLLLTLKESALCIQVKKSTQS